MVEKQAKKAQDDARENQQLERLKMVGTARGSGADAYYRMDVECKSRSLNSGQTTKREYGNAHLKAGGQYDPLNPVDDPFKNTVIYSCLYSSDDPTKVLPGKAFLIFPEGMLPFTETYRRKLVEDNGTKLCHQEVDYLTDCMDPNLSAEKVSKVEEIIAKARKAVYYNDPSIPYTFFKEDGKKAYGYDPVEERSKKMDNRYPEWFIPLSDDWDHSEEVRKHIDNYIAWKKSLLKEAKAA